MKLILAISLIVLASAAQATVTCHATFEPGSQSITLTESKTIQVHTGLLNEYEIKAWSSGSLVRVEITDQQSGATATSGPLKASEHQSIVRLRMKNAKTGHMVKVFCSLQLVPHAVGNGGFSQVIPNL